MPGILKLLLSISFLLLTAHMCCKRLPFQHQMGILPNRSIFAPLLPFKLNSCTHYVQYNTNPVGLLHCAIRAHNDYVIPLFSKCNQELTLSHFHGRSLEQQSHEHVGCSCGMWKESLCRSIDVSPSLFDLLNRALCVPEDHFLPSKALAKLNYCPSRLPLPSCGRLAAWLWACCV